MRRPGGTPARNDALGADVIAGDALMLWSTRRVRCAVLTPEPVGVELEAAGWTALDAFRWTDGDTVLGWPMAHATMERRRRRNGAA